MVFLEIIWIAIKLTLVLAIPIVIAAGIIYGIAFVIIWAERKLKSREERKNAEQSAEKETGEDY